MKMRNVEPRQIKGGYEVKIFGRVLCVLYGFFRKRRKICNLILCIVLKMEGGMLYSITLRRILARYHKVQIGLYTHGSCFEPGNFDKFTTVGRYCSIGANVKVFNRNHPMNFKSMHAFFFNPYLKSVKQDMIEYIPLNIGNDVWIGDGVKIMPRVTRIGDGVVVGAGSVLTKNLPPYAIAVGYPASIVRYRFPNEIIKKLFEEKWWEKDIEQIKPNIKEYQQPYEAFFHSEKAGFTGKNDKGDDS